MQRGAGGSNSGAMMQTYAVTVPPGVGPGQQFQASLDGQLTMVIVPHGSGPNSTLHVQIPVRPCSVQKYAITIPAGVHPGGRFQANLGGQLVWLNCPRSLGPGKQMLVDASSAGVNQPKTWPPPIGMPEGIDGAPRRPTPPPTTPRAPDPRSYTPLRPPCGRRPDPHPARAGKEVPEYFQCPITGCIMRQPAMTPDGVTYDYDAITEWLQSKQTDPTTNQPLSVDQLCPNRTVRSMIEDFIAKGPNFLMMSK